MGTLLYQMATGSLPFQGETSAVVFEAILNRDPDASESSSIRRCRRSSAESSARPWKRTATCDIRVPLIEDRAQEIEARPRLIGTRHADRTEWISVELRRPTEHSVAVLYFENLSGMKEDEYLRDGITEDITTELSKIKGLKTFSRAMVLPYRDKSVTAGQVGKELGASYVLVGSLRRAGARLRINAQLVDAANRFPDLVGTVRPRDGGCVRSPGRDRAEDRRRFADHALAAGAAGSVGKTD